MGLSQKELNEILKDYFYPYWNSYFENKKWPKGLVITSQDASRLCSSPLATHLYPARPDFTETRNCKDSFSSLTRKHIIDTITIHCTAGQGTARDICNVLNNTSRRASCNYAVGKDGSIAICVPECFRRSYCSSDYDNDCRAVTLEVSSASSYDYAVTDEAYEAMLNLIVDICKRNKIKKLVWSTSATDRKEHLNGCNMTVHRDFNTGKSCPGKYLYDRHGEIAQIVNNCLLGITELPQLKIPPAIDEAVSDKTLTENNLDLQAMLRPQINVQILDIFDTKASFKCSVTTQPNRTNLFWYYQTTEIKNGVTQSSKPQEISLNKTVLINGLIPDTFYFLEVFAVTAKNTDVFDSKKVIKSNRVAFCTLQTRPGSVQNLQIKEMFNNFTFNPSYELSFDSPNTWGSAHSAYKKGFKVSIIINNKIEKTFDLSGQQISSKIKKTITLADFFTYKEIVDMFNNNVAFQVGVQSWLYDNTNQKYLFDANFPKCTQPSNLKVPMKIVDKLFIKESGAFRRSTLYSNI